MSSISGQKPFSIIRFGHGNLDPFKLLTCDGSQLVGDPAGLPFRDDAEAKPDEGLTIATVLGSRI
jgi:hypothetical protein